MVCILVCIAKMSWSVVTGNTWIGNHKTKVKDAFQMDSSLHDHGSIM